MPRKGDELIHTDGSCTAKTRDGDLCKNPPMLGARTCRMHGSATKAARAKAAERLEASVDRLLAALIQIAEDDNQPAASRVAAIKDALDRADFGTRANKVTVEVKPYLRDLDGLFVDVDDADPRFVRGQVVGGHPPELGDGLPDEAGG